MPYFAIVVDQMVGGRENLKVAEIVREPVGDLFEYHIICCKKRVKTADNDSEWERNFVWKTYYRQPDEVQYQIPGEKYDYIKI